MTNAQQPEMRRSERDPLVQESKLPRPGDPHQAKGGQARPVPREQVSPYGPSPRPVAAREEDRDRKRHKRPR